MTDTAFELPCVIKYYDDGWRTAIFTTRGPMYVTLISMDGLAGQTVHIRKWLKSREREFKVLLSQDKPYSPKRAARHFLNAARTLGITKSAQVVLESILDGKPAPSDDMKSRAKTGDIDMPDVTITVDPKEYKQTKAASGRKSLDTGDKVAKELRGLTLDEVYEVAAKHLGETKLALKRKYGKLNPGMQRMNLGNRMRKKVEK